MIPQIFKIGIFPINSFGLMVALSLIVGTFRLSQSFKSVGLDEKLAEKYVLLGGISGLFGARIWYLFENYEDIKFDILGAIFSSAGFTFYGGFIISFFTLFIMSKKDKIPSNKILDACGPTLALGYAIGRLGCQLSGDGDYGVPTLGFWGMSYSTGVIPTPPGVFVYPTPLFESAISILICLLLIYFENRGKKLEDQEGSKSLFSIPYIKFGLYLGLISLERFFIEIYRINPKIIATFSEAQIVSICFFTISIIICSSSYVLFKNKL